MHTDDLLLLFATVHGFQQMLNWCSGVCVKSLLKFNCKKSNCCVILDASKFDIQYFKLEKDVRRGPILSNTWVFSFLTGRNFLLQSQALNVHF